MSKKLICLIYFVLVLCLVGTSAAQNVDPSLVGWWKLDETFGIIAYDSSGHDNHGSLCGDPQWLAGKIDGALEFDGRDDFVDTYYATDLPVWTICTWVISPYAPSGAMPSGPVHREKNYQINWNHVDTTFRGAAALHVGGIWYAASFGHLEANTWYHLAATYNRQVIKSYKNGVIITSSSAPSGNPSPEWGTLKFARHSIAPQYFGGTIDDVRIYNKALSEAEIRETMRGDTFVADNPDPADGAMYGNTWVNLGWTPGTFAVSHDVYFGDNFEDVEAGTGGTFQGNQTASSFTVGVAGFPYPDGLVLGTTYYWRVDEVNAPPDSTIHRGDVWSFTVAEPLSEALDTALSFTTGGSADWFAQTTTSRYDGDAAQSPDISHRQDSWMQTTVSGTGTIQFYWKVSSEEDFDFLEFYVDGSLQDRISGLVNWEHKTYTISTSGPHTFEWRYMKDGSGNYGSDCGWVDKVEW